MALNGEFSKYTTHIQYAEKFGLYCTWEGEQKYSGNCTDVTVTVYLSYYNIDVGAKTCTVSVGGKSATFTSPQIKHYNNAWTKRLLGSVKVNVAHNTDGTMPNCGISVTFPYSGSMNGISVPSIVAETTVALDPIPRASVPTLSNGNVTMETNVRIYTNRKSTAFTHKIYCVFGSKKIDIGNNVGDSVVWKPPISLAGQIPSDWSGKGTIHCETYNGGVFTGSNTVSITLTVPDNDTTKPKITITSVSGIDLFQGLYLQGVSKIQAKYSIETSYSGRGKLAVELYDSSGVKRGGISGGWSSAESGVISSSGEYCVRVTAVNSRGQSRVVSSESIYVHSYTAPSVSIVQCDRCTEGEVPKRTGLKLKITASRGFSSLNGKNQCELRYRIKKYDGKAFSESDPWNVLLSMDNSSNQYSGVVCDVEKKKSYSVEIGVVDSVGKSSSVIKYIKTAQISFHLKRTAAAFGKYIEEDELLDVEWNVKVRKGLSVLGNLFIGGEPLVNKVYPVGSIYMSLNDVSPESFLGGTWERIQDRFLLGAGGSYSVGRTGGEDSHILTTAEMPVHTHTISVTGGDHQHSVGTQEADYNTGSGYRWTLVRPDGSSSSASGTVDGGSHTHTASATNAGSGNAHNNMPPYLAVYMWKRTK